eukprot:TRINITY_DN17117_c0_g1_i1.p1 TRINITY_DN17117_c0_g1~~TRINITY_DN17117_c0_g1_i1.p1  ORF type:complete len:581 (+),score=124.96 TRINITY_DN17117_c0_g1_i1:117-1859(+)
METKDEADMRYLREKGVTELIDGMMRQLLSGPRKEDPGTWILRYLKGMIPKDEYVPKTLWVSIDEVPTLSGTYRLTKEQYNNKPVWSHSDCRIYSTKSGYWMVTDDKAKMKDNKGLVSTKLTTLPHLEAFWEVSKDGQWVKSTVSITDTLHIADPVSVSPSRYESPSSPMGKPGGWDSPRGIRPPGAGLGEVFLPRAISCKPIKRHISPLLYSGEASMQGWRASMEDASYMSSNLNIICDGHGGVDVARAVTETFPKAVSDILNSAPGQLIPDEQLKNICLLIDKAILCSSLEGGCTATFSIIIPRDGGEYGVQLANVGDTRGLAFRRPTEPDATPQLLCATVDHKPTSESEMERIQSSGHGEHLYAGRVDSLGVSRAFGDKAFKDKGIIAEPGIYNTTCMEGDIIVLACDGVFDHLCNEEVMNIIHQTLLEHNDPSAAAAAVCDAALRKGSTDNISCAVTVLSSDSSNVRNLPSLECIPGPYIAAWDSSFRAGYILSVSEAGLTLPEALEKRYEDVTSLLQKMPPNESSIDAIALRDEFALFHTSSEAILDLRKRVGKERRQWFEEWAQSVAIINTDGS